MGIAQDKFFLAKYEAANAADATALVRQLMLTQDGTGGGLPEHGITLRIGNDTDGKKLHMYGIENAIEGWYPVDSTDEQAIIDAGVDGAIGAHQDNDYIEWTKDLENDTISGRVKQADKLTSGHDFNPSTPESHRGATVADLNALELEMRSDLSNTDQSVEAVLSESDTVPGAGLYAIELDAPQVQTLNGVDTTVYGYISGFAGDGSEIDANTRVWLGEGYVFTVDASDTDADDFQEKYVKGGVIRDLNRGVQAHGDLTGLNGDAEGYHLSQAGADWVEANKAADFAMQAELDAAKADLEAADTALDGRVSANETTVATNSSRLTSAETTITQHGTRLGQAESDIDAIEAAATALTERVSTNESDIDAIEAAATALTGRVSTNESDIDAIETAATALTDRVSTNESDIDAIETAATALTGRVDSAETTIAAHGGRLTATETATATNTSDISDNADAIIVNANAAAAAQAKANTNETNIAGIDTRLGQAETDIAAHGGRLTATETATATNTSDISDNADAIVVNANAAAAAQAKANTNETNIAGIDTRLGQAEADIAAHEADITAIETAASALTGRVSANESNIDAIETAATALTDRVTTVETDLDTAEANIGTLQGQMTQVMADIIAAALVGDTNLASINAMLGRADVVSTTHPNVADGGNPVAPEFLGQRYCFQFAVPPSVTPDEEMWFTYDSVNNVWI